MSNFLLGTWSYTTSISTIMVIPAVWKHQENQGERSLPIGWCFQGSAAASQKSLRTKQKCNKMQQNMDKAHKTFSTKIWHIEVINSKKQT